MHCAVRHFVDGPDGGPFWLHDFFLFLIVVVLVAGALLVVLLLSRQSMRPRGWWRGYGPPPWKPNAALAELDLRYARGEIDRAEYLQRRADLLGAPPPHPGDTRPTGPTPG